MKAWWDAVTRKFELDDHHRHLLQVACETWDRLTQARLAVAEHGLTYQDRHGNVRIRPEVKIENECRISFARLIRDLGLDHPKIEKEPGGIGWRPLR
jgi:phage terminase small subunit